MRRRVLGWLALAILAAGCGKYGPPVRSEPPTPIEEPQEEDEQAEVETP